MKKVNTSPRAQARRARALARFSINSRHTPESNPGYNERKATELAALKSRLGVAA